MTNPSVWTATVPNSDRQQREINWSGGSVRLFVPTLSVPDVAATRLENQPRSGYPAQGRDHHCALRGTLALWSRARSQRRILFVPGRVLPRRLLLRGPDPRRSPLGRGVIRRSDQPSTVLVFEGMDSTSARRWSRHGSGRYARIPEEPNHLLQYSTSGRLLAPD
jgi:hypothetical protein